MATDSARAADGPTPAYRYRFGSAEFDESRFELRVGGLLVELQLKPLQLLALLLATPGEVVGKERIFSELWNDRATGDAVLANAASKLRAALGEANAGAIVTVPRSGYRFDGPLERIAVGRRLASEIELAPGAAVPGRAGHRLLRQLGRSARSETWRAEQPRTGDHRVFKFALDGERLADLKREVTLSRVLREALGERDDIARVLDWNFETAPFWIECEDGGDDLEVWAAAPQGGRDGNRAAGAGDTHLQALSRTERIGFAIAIADALAAAHSAAVLHKDLKPANVLVAAHGDGWRLRLADFGSGRLLDPSQLERLRVTRLGLTVDGDDATSGTPHYIAPELLASAAPSPASDVFALGVMLYQLLAGDLRRPLAPGWERDIDDELLREDVAQATDIDPQHRIGSAAELATRLRGLDARRTGRDAAQRERQRAAAEQAELARLRLRRPWVVATVGVLAAGVVVSLLLYAAQHRAAQALARENQVSTALGQLLREDLIGAANPGRNGRADITVADALSGAAERVETRFATLPAEVRGQLHAAMQQSLADLSRAREAVAAGRRAVAALAEAAGSTPTGALQSARLRLALDLVQTSQLDEARRVVAAIESGVGTNAPPLFRARLLFVKAWVTDGDLALETSTAQLREAFALVEGLSEDQAPGRGAIGFSLADNLSLMGRHTEAEGLYRRLHGEQVQRYGAEHPRAMYVLVGLGSVLVRSGRHDDAQATLQRASAGLAATLGAEHRQTLTALDMLADLRFRRADFAGAAADWARVQAGYAALLGEGSSYTLTPQTNRALALHRLGRPAAAELLLRSALGHAGAFLKEDSPQLQQIRFALADCLVDLKRPAEAAPLLTGLNAEALNVAQPEPDWPQRLQALRARTRAAPKP